MPACCSQRAARSSCSTRLSTHWRPHKPSPRTNLCRYTQRMEINMTRPSLISPESLETTSRRGLLLAAAGLGVAGLANALTDPSESKVKNATLTVPPASEAVTEFRFAVPAAALDDLQTRLATARWPEQETVNDWSEGVPLARMKALAEYWRSSYDMRRLERR